MKDFMKDFGNWVRTVDGADRYVSLYERGYITLIECIHLIEEREVLSIRRSNGYL